LPPELAHPDIGDGAGEVVVLHHPLHVLEFCRRHGIACQANPYGGIGTNRFVPRKDYVGPWFVSEMHPNGVTEWMVRPIAVAGIVQLVELDRQPMPRQAPKRLGDDNGERRA
jgi:hypothetical protein